MIKAFDVDCDVAWNWGSGTGRGTIREVYRQSVAKAIKSSEIKRNADADNLAYLIEQEDGDRVLKSHSALSAVSS